MRESLFFFVLCFFFREGGDKNTGSHPAPSPNPPNPQPAPIPTKNTKIQRYAGLRTNLPREVMSYASLPFTPRAMAAAGVESRDARRFPGHEEVLSYLKAYARHHRLGKHVRFGARVVSAAPVWPAGAGEAGEAAAGEGGAAAERAKVWPRWELKVEEIKSSSSGGNEDGGKGGSHYSETFDALVVCNGHYSATNVPRVPGADAFPGELLHSHNYREPGRFAGLRVLVVGASNSGEDLCREIASVADSVFLSARSWKNSAWADDAAAAASAPFGPRGNIERRGMVSALRGDGSADFEAGARAERLDAVVFATGYRYDFPFLRGSVLPASDDDDEDEEVDDDNKEVEGASGGTAQQRRRRRRSPEEVAAGPLSTEGQRVAPLYGHVFYPPLAPTLSFVGLPWKVVPFPQFELQSRWVARALSGRAAPLPSEAAMRADAASFYRRLAESGVPDRWTHMQGDLQWGYNEWLLEQSDGRPDRQSGRRRSKGEEEETTTTAAAAAARAAKEEEEEYAMKPWRAAMYSATGASKRAHPEDYRDRWEEEEDGGSLAAALEDLAAIEERVAAAEAAAADAAAVGA